MIVILSALAGAIYGGWRAKSRDGNRLDIAQYAAIYALIFGTAGIFVTIALSRMG
jgi:hypothetical protein